MIPVVTPPNALADCGKRSIGAAILSRFSRVTAGGRIIPQIDGLRFVAIMAVLAYHVCSMSLHHFGLPRIEQVALGSNLGVGFFAVGHYGVQLFFAISGFILCVPFAKLHMFGGGKLPLKHYYIRRITRIEPPYVIHLLFVFALCLLVFRNLPSHPHLYGNPEWYKEVAKHLLPSLFYSHGFLYSAHPYPNIVLWSLETEVQFYLLAPLLACVFKIPSVWARRLLIISAAAASTILACLSPSYLIAFSLAGNLQFFLTGFLLADIYLCGKLENSGSWIWDAIATAGIIAAAWWPASQVLAICMPLVILVLCVAAFRGRLVAAFLSNPVVVTIGGMCYTIYLYHVLILSPVLRITAKHQVGVLWIDLLIQLALCAMFVIPVCAVFFALFERPFMSRDWPSRTAAFFRQRFQS